ncbi:hypothetical protein Tco_0367536 [Tanacetum coccineum]
MLIVSDYLSCKEKALSIYRDVYPKWCLEFFLTMYFDRGVDRTKLMTDKCIWFRLCGVEKVLTLPEFAVLLGLYEEDELNHRAGSKERCQKRDMWIMSALEESRGINLAWVITEHLCMNALGIKENSLICRGHYVTKIAHLLGYLNDEEVAKCSEPIEYETWTIKMLANKLDEDTYSLIQTEQEGQQPGQARRQGQEPRGLDSSWGDWNASLNEIERRDVWRDSMLMRNNYILEHSTPILYHLAD